MELRQLRYFQALAEELHFGRAAERVHIVQPALSRQIAALEKELGMKLFERSTRAVALTPAGEALRERVSAILPALDDAVAFARNAEQGEAGSIDLGFIRGAMWTVLPAILTEHRRRFPNVAFHLHELPMMGEHMEALTGGALDVAFVRPMARYRALEYRTLLIEKLVAVLPEGHHLAAHEVIDLADLADENFVLMRRHLAPLAYDRIQQACLDAGFLPRLQDDGDSQEAARLVACGFGVALASESIAHGGYQGVVCRPLRQDFGDFELAVAHRRGELPTLVADFMDTIGTVMAARAGAGGATGD